MTRSSQPDHVTCQSGGFIASGPTEADKAPVPFLPEGLKPTRGEGFGEVQTPLLVPPALRGKLQPGDPVFFRPAKAGEIAERFQEYLLVQDGTHHRPRQDLPRPGVLLPLMSDGAGMGARDPASPTLPFLPSCSSCPSWLHSFLPLRASDGHDRVRGSDL